MKRKYISLLTKMVLPLVISVVLVATGCSAGKAPRPSTNNGSVATSNSLIRTSNGGAVDIQVKWDADNKDYLVFEISMDTHSVDLDKYDLKQSTVLHDSQGNEYQPLSWNSAAGGHHRSGKLTFAVPDSLQDNTTEFLHMVIRNVGISERSLEWDIG